MRKVFASIPSSDVLEGEASHLATPCASSTGLGKYAINLM